MDSDTHPTTSVATRRVPVVEVPVHGQLGAQSAPRVHDVLQEAMRLSPTNLIIDRAGCPSIDAAGIMLLLETHRRTVSSGGTVALRRPSPGLCRNLRLARVGRVLTVLDPQTGEPSTYAVAAPNQVDSQWQHRLRNAMLLSTYAEALAAPFAGKPLPEPESVTHALTNPDSDRHRPGCGSAQMLVVAQHLATHAGTIAEDELATTLAARCGTHASEPVSTGTHKVLTDIAQGTPWWEAAPSLHERRGSYGNDAAVRANPIGLVAGTPLATIATLARRSATITHTHLLARDGAAMQAVAVALAARGHPSPTFDTARFLATLAEQTRTPELRAALGIVRTLVRHRAGATETAATVGNDNTALKSVPAALTAFLRHPDAPIAAIRYAILIGGHTTAIAAMTGALAGARCPGMTTPVGWAGLADALALRLAAADLAKVGQP